MKRCPKCKEQKSVSEFNKDRSKGDGLRTYCRTCDNWWSKWWAHANPEKVNERSRRWAHANPEKVRERGHKWREANIEKARARERIRWASRRAITEEVRLALSVFYKYTCLCCGRKEPEIELEFDHVIPLKLGGKDTTENLQLLCRSCNAGKGAKSTDYRQEVFYY